MENILFAPAGYWKLTEAGKREICNGCGPQSKKDFIPDTIWGLNITEACNIHDYCYVVAPPKIEAKDEADRIFLNNMLRLIAEGTRFAFLRWLRRSRALTYYRAVKYFGGPFFWKNK